MQKFSESLGGSDFCLYFCNIFCATQRRDTDDLLEIKKKRYARLAPWNLRNFKFAQEGDVVAFPNKTTN